MTILLVGLGGFVGSVTRYLLSRSVQDWAGGHWFPWGTLTVNVIGCLVIGLLAGLSEHRDLLGPNTRALLFVGLLGGFTTFSAFGNETVGLWRDGHSAQAAGNVALQLVLGLGAVWVGLRVARALWET